MANPFGHFCTITKHRHQVIVHCFKAGIPLRGLFHDLSKYTPAEFLAGARFYKGTRSPNEAEREKYGYSAAWLHHKGRNRHHFEYWTDYNPETKKVGPVKMPMPYLKEMFCDRVAASKIYQGKNYTDKHPLEYFLRGKDNRSIHPETSDLLEHWLTVLAEQGEDAAFKCIKEY
ncbi:MAG: catalase [Clostridia bacterium]|nr:catalase [Clostridia bacterium]